MRHLCIISTVIVLFSYVLFATDGIKPAFMGARGAGRGGADIAVANDPTCINTNPSGIAFIYGKMVEFDPAVFYLNLSYSDSRNSSATTDFEPVPGAFFGMAWDTPSQTGEIFLDPWLYMFGSKPDHTYGISGSFEGKGAVEFQVDKVPKQISLAGWGREVAVSQVEVYARLPRYRDPSGFQSVLRSQSIGKLPFGAVLLNVAVSFQWYVPVLLNMKEVKASLKTEEKEHIVTLSGISARWNQEYLPLIMTDQTHPPDFIEFSIDPGEEEIQIRNVEITIGYRVGETVYYRKVGEEKGSKGVGIGPRYFLIAADEGKEVTISARQTIVSFNKFSPLPGDSQPDRIRVTYSYRFSKPKIEAKYLTVSVMDENENELASATESAPWAGIEEKGYAPYPPPPRPENYRRLDPNRESGFKFGFGVFPQGGSRFLLKTNTELFPEGIENRSNMLSISLAPAIAYRYKDRFAVGVALNLNYQTLEIDGLLSQPSAVLKGKTFSGITFDTFLKGITGLDELKAEVDTNTLKSLGLGLRVGMMWNITDRITIGAMFSPKPWMQKMKGKGTVDFGRYFDNVRLTEIIDIGTLFLLPNAGLKGFAGEYDIEADMVLPAEAGAGISILLTEQLLLAVDFKWVNYSNTMNDIKITLKDGDNPDLNYLTAGPDVYTSIHPGWKDQYVVAVGLCWQATSDWTFRIGYNFGSNPVPEKYYNPQLPPVSEHNFTFGFSYRWDTYLTLSLGMEIGIPSTFKSAKVNEYNSDYNNSKIDIFQINTVIGMNFHF